MDTHAPRPAYASTPTEAPAGAVDTSTPHPEVAAALDLLTQVLADPDHSAVDVRLASAVADVLSDLIDCHPPLPPLDYPSRGAADDDAALQLLQRAATRLQAAARDSHQTSERLRVGIAARRLRALVEQWHR